MTGDQGVNGSDDTGRAEAGSQGAWRPAEVDALLCLTGDEYLRLNPDGTVQRLRCSTPRTADPPIVWSAPVPLAEAYPPHVVAILEDGIREAVETRRMAVRTVLSGAGPEVECREARFMPLQTGPMAVVLRDTTEQYAHERSLRASEERYRALVEISPFGLQFFSTDEAGRLLLTGANPAADAVLDTSHAALVGRRVDEAFPGSTLASMERAFVDVAEQGGRCVLESVAYAGPDPTRVYDVTAFGLDRGHMVAVSQDVTARAHHAEKEAAYLRRLQRLAHQLVHAEDQERRQLAVDLHDRVGQHLAVAFIRVSEAIRAADPLDRENALDSTLDLLKEAIDETRAITRELSPSTLYELGLAAALRGLVEGLQNSYGLTCDVDIADNVYAPDIQVGAFLCRSARELLVNVAKHSGSDRAFLGVEEKDGMLSVVVEDHGVGVGDGKWESSSETFGLLSIRERASALGGRMEVGAGKDGTGTRVLVTVPLMAPR